jgi:hypothetical protein
MDTECELDLFLGRYFSELGRNISNAVNVQVSLSLKARMGPQS